MPESLDTEEARYAVPQDKHPPYPLGGALVARREDAIAEKPIKATLAPLVTKAEVVARPMCQADRLEMIRRIARRLE